MSLTSPSGARAIWMSRGGRAMRRVTPRAAARRPLRTADLRAHGVRVRAGRHGPHLPRPADRRDRHRDPVRGHGAADPGRLPELPGPRPVVVLTGRYGRRWVVVGASGASADTEPSSRA